MDRTNELKAKVLDQEAKIGDLKVEVLVNDLGPAVACMNMVQAYMNDDDAKEHVLSAMTRLKEAVKEKVEAAGIFKTRN